MLKRVGLGPQKAPKPEGRSGRLHRKLTNYKQLGVWGEGQPIITQGVPVPGNEHGSMCAASLKDEPSLRS